MRRSAAPGALLLLLCAGGLEARAGTPPCARPAYAVSRWLEDYTFLEDPACRSELWDPAKFIELSNSPETWLSLGADVRQRYELLDHPDFSTANRDTGGYWLQRYMVHADLHVGAHARAFVQLKSGLEDWRNGGPRPTDEDRLDLHQAFAEGEIDLDRASSLSLRLGRQEVAFGSQRLISVRESPNVRRSFDGARATLLAHGWRLDGLLLAPVQTDRGVFDDDTEQGQQLWGAYAVGPVLGKALDLDLYYLGYRNDDAEFDVGTGRERRHSVGTRIWGKPGAADYNFELVYQWGSFADGSIEAWTVASDTGWTFEDVPAQPRVSLRANVTSGDGNPDDDRLGTFNPLFPRGSYFGEASLIGPQNHMDLHPMLDLHPRDDVTVTLDWDFFWRESTSDAVYKTSGAPLVPGDASDARYVGSQGSLEVEWELDRHVTLSGAYEHFFAGPFLRDAGRTDVDYVSVWLNLRI